MPVAHIFDADERTDDIQTDKNFKFENFLLSPQVLQGLKNAGFIYPSRIQTKAIPLAKCGVDLVCQAKSGTGKTCVFAVTALEAIDISCSNAQVLVLAPTREIAVQINDVILSIGACIQGLCSALLIGGTSENEDYEKLKKCHIVVGSPGRVKSLIEKSILVVSSVRLFILDEADKLLESGMQDQVNWIFSTLPVHKQTLALSATFPSNLSDFLNNYMKEPIHIRINPHDLALKGVKQYFCDVKNFKLQNKVFEGKTNVLVKLLKSIPFHQCMVFSNLQSRAEYLSNLLTRQGWPSTYIAGKQAQSLRLKAMEKLKKFDCRVLVTTDLTSRGIDCEKVNLVVNLDLPRDTETYLHRVGRSGRFGSHAIAISIISDGKECEQLKVIAKEMRKDILHISEYSNRNGEKVKIDIGQALLNKHPSIRWQELLLSETTKNRDFEGKKSHSVTKTKEKLPTSNIDSFQKPINKNCNIEASDNSSKVVMQTKHNFSSSPISNEIIKNSDNSNINDNETVIDTRTTTPCSNYSNQSIHSDATQKHLDSIQSVYDHSGKTETIGNVNAKDLVVDLAIESLSITRNITHTDNKVFHTQKQDSLNDGLLSASETLDTVSDCTKIKVEENLSSPQEFHVKKPSVILQEKDSDLLEANTDSLLSNEVNHTKNTVASTETSVNDTNILDCMKKQDESRHSSQSVHGMKSSNTMQECEADSVKTNVPSLLEDQLKSTENATEDTKRICNLTPTDENYTTVNSRESITKTEIDTFTVPIKGESGNALQTNSNSIIDTSNDLQTSQSNSKSTEQVKKKKGSNKFNFMCVGMNLLSDSLKISSLQKSSIPSSYVEENDKNVVKNEAEPSHTINESTENSKPVIIYKRDDDVDDYGSDTCTDVISDDVDNDSDANSSVYDYNCSIPNGHIVLDDDVKHDTSSNVTLSNNLLRSDSILSRSTASADYNDDDCNVRGGVISSSNSQENKTTIERLSCSTNFTQSSKSTFSAISSGDDTSVSSKTTSTCSEQNISSMFRKNNTSRRHVKKDHNSTHSTKNSKQSFPYKQINMDRFEICWYNAYNNHLKHLYFYNKMRNSLR